MSIYYNETRDTTMLENFIQFLKKTFTYAEESSAQTPSTVSSAPKSETKPQQNAGNPQQISQPVFTPAPEVQVRRANIVRGESDPQKAAQQQADNFAALRPKPGDNPFRMSIEKVFFAKGSGVVVTGTIGQGVARVGAKSLIVHAANKTTIETRVIGIERNGQLVNSAPAGSAVGLLLEHITRNDVHGGDVIGEISE